MISWLFIYYSLQLKDIILPLPHILLSIVHFHSSLALFVPVVKVTPVNAFVFNHLSPSSSIALFKLAVVNVSGRNLHAPAVIGIVFVSICLAMVNVAVIKLFEYDFFALVERLDVVHVNPLLDVDRYIFWSD